MSASRASGRPGPAGQALARQPVGRLPGHVAEHIDLEALLERLALEQARSSESRSADGIGEDVVEHGDGRLSTTDSTGGPADPRGPPCPGPFRAASAGRRGRRRPRRPASRSACPGRGRPGLHPHQDRMPVAAPARPLQRAANLRAWAGSARLSSSPVRTSVAGSGCPRPRGGTGNRPTARRTRRRRRDRRTRGPQAGDEAGKADHVGQRHRADDGSAQVRTLGLAGRHQQAAVAAPDRQPVTGGPARRDQEVGRSVKSSNTCCLCRACRRCQSSPSSAPPDRRPRRRRRRRQPPPPPGCSRLIVTANPP